MPRLPDASTLGQLGTLNSGRPVATYDPSGYGKAAEALAQGTKDLGKGIKDLGTGVADFAEKQQKAAGSLQDAQATAYYTANKTQLDSDREDEDDPAEVAKYPQKHQELLEQSAAIIQDPQARELWKLKRIPEVTTQKVAADEKAFTLNRDQAFADSQTQLFDLQKKGALAKTDADRAAIIKSGHDLIDGLENEGYIDAADAVKRRQAFANGYAVSTFQALPAGQRLAAIDRTSLDDKSKQAFQFFVKQGWSPAQASGIVGNLIHESGLNTGALNPGDGSDGSDSIGIAQWNAGRAKALKAYAARKGSDWRDLQTQLEFVHKELQSTHSEAGDALLAAKTPREAAAAFVTEFERPKGSDRGAEYAHGWQNRLSKANAVAATYGKDVTPAAGEPLLKFMTLEQVATQHEQATREIVQQDRQAKQAQGAEAATVKQLVDDDHNSIVETGKPIADLSVDRVARALGPEKAAEFVGNRARAVRYHDATNDWSVIPASEIAARVESLRPEGGKPGYNAQDTYYQAARKAADPILKERREDPAAAADRLPEVQAVKAQANLDNPESFQALVKARLVAARRLGTIPPPLPGQPDDSTITGAHVATRAEAAAIVAPIQNAVAGSERQTLKTLIPVLDQRYGAYSQRVLEYALEVGKQDNDTAKLAASVFRQLHMGTTPQQTDLEAITKTQTNAAMAAAAGNARRPELGVDPLTGAPVPASPDLAPKAAPAPSRSAPPDEVIADLIRNPSKATAVDAQYGKGTAEKVFSKYRSMTKAAP